MARKNLQQCATTMAIYFEYVILSSNPTVTDGIHCNTPSPVQTALGTCVKLSTMRMSIWGWVATSPTKI